MVRVRKTWQVDLGTCVPFCSEHDGCAICLSVCTWSRPAVAPSLVQKILQKRAMREAATDG